MDSSASCSRCSATIPPGARFCAACGHELKPKTRLLQSERRSLTFLFCDLLDSSGLSTRLDPEDLRELIRSYRSRCREAIRSYSGRSTQEDDRATEFSGDGVMTFFGYPIAHEDDDVRATRAALRILDKIKAVNEAIGKRFGVELHVRIGLHTGEAVVGELGPTDSNQFSAIGESVNLAARIQGTAAPDTVVVSQTTAKRIEGHFQVEALDPRSLKGFDEKINLFRIVAATGARTKLEAAARGQLTPRVGRESEMTAIGAAWTDAQKGASRVVFVRGEAGIGKSRLIHDFRQSMLATGSTRRDVIDHFAQLRIQVTRYRHMPVVRVYERT